MSRLLRQIASNLVLINPNLISSSSHSKTQSIRLSTRASTGLPRPYTLADKDCPYILHLPTSATTSTDHDPLDYELYPKFFNLQQQAIWTDYLLSILDSTPSPSLDLLHLKSFQAPNRYDFQPGHSTSAARQFRLKSIDSIPELDHPLIQALLDRLLRLMNARAEDRGITGHVLHLSPSGSIQAHLDHPSESGPTTLALSLGHQPKIMHLYPNLASDQPIYKILLEPGSVYLHR